MDILFISSAVLICLLIATVFIAQRHGRSNPVYRLGNILILLSIPFAIYLIYSDLSGKGISEVIALLFVLGYLLAEFLLDYVFKIDFRSRWATHIPCILLEYAAFFGFIFTALDISQLAGWVVSILLWIAMAAFIYLYAGAKNRV